jgi:hypothetical protein
MHDALHRSQPYARAFERFGRVKALEYPEQLIHIRHIESDSIIADEHYYLIGPLLLARLQAPDFDFGLRAGSRKFDGVCNQVDENKP